MNTWEDQRVVDVVQKTGKKKIVLAALWTEVCGVLPALSALEQGYEVYFVTDASGGVTKEAHDMAVQRMVQAGAKPITWVQYLLELQRDWARGETYAAVMDIAKEHAGGYGLGMIYAERDVRRQGRPLTREPGRPLQEWPPPLRRGIRVAWRL